MGPSAAELAILVRVRDQASRALGGIRGALGGVGRTLQNLRMPLMLGAAAIAGLGAAAISAGSDLTEAMNKADVTFQASAAQIEKFAATSAKSFGIPKRAAYEYTSVLGNIAQASGLSRAASADLALGITELSADMASFNNIPIDVALEKLRAGLVGEAEPLRTVGVLISDAAVKAQAAKEGIAELGAELTEGQKVQARYALILEQTANAQGDFTRTSGDAANAQRILSARLDDLRASVGQQLMPAWMAIINFASETLVPMMEQWIPKAVDRTKEAFADLRPALLTAFDTLKWGAEVAWPPVKAMFQFILDNEVALVLAFSAIGLAIAAVFGPAGLLMFAIGLITSFVGVIKIMTADIADLELGTVRLRRRLTELVGTFWRMIDAMQDWEDVLRKLPGPLGWVGSGIANVIDHLQLLEVAGLDADRALATVEAELALLDRRLRGVADQTELQNTLEALKAGAIQTGDGIRYTRRRVEEALPRLAQLGATISDLQAVAFRALPTWGDTATRLQLIAQAAANTTSAMAALEYMLTRVMAAEGVLAAQQVAFQSETLLAAFGQLQVPPLAPPPPPPPPPPLAAAASAATEAAETLLDQLAAFESDIEQAWAIIAQTIERGVVRWQDVLTLTTLGVFGREVADDFVRALQGESSRIGDAIFDAAADRAAEAAREAAEAFAQSFADAIGQVGDLIAAVSQRVAGYVGADTMESLHETLRSLQLRQQLPGLQAAADAATLERMAHLVVLEGQLADARERVAATTEQITDQQEAVADIEKQIADAKEVYDWREVTRLAERFRREARRLDILERVRITEERSIRGLEASISATEQLRSEEELQLQAIHDEIAALEDLAEARRIEREIAVTLWRLNNERLPTDQEVLANIEAETLALRELRDTMAILNDGVLDVRDAFALLSLGLDDLAQHVLDIISGLVPGLVLPGAGGQRQIAGQGNPAPVQQISIHRMEVHGNSQEILREIGGLVS